MGALAYAVGVELHELRPRGNDLEAVFLRADRRGGIVMIGLIRSELLKVVTTRVWWGLLIGVVAQSVALTLLTTLLSTVGTPDGGSGPDWHDPAWARTVYSSGLSIAYLCTLALGALSMSGERRHRTLSITLLASPHRWRVVVAKLVAVVVAGTGYGIATVLASVVVGAPILASKGGSTMLTDGSVLRAMALTAARARAVGRPRARGRHS